MPHLRKNFEIYGKTLSVGGVKPVGEAHKASYMASYNGEAAFIIGAENVGDVFSGTVCAVIERDKKELPVLVPSELYGKDICYECNIRAALGGLMRDGDLLYAKFEKTCGAIMFTYKDGERRYLIIKSNNKGGHIGFPKGHIEYGESELETAEREVREETGLKFVPYGDFRAEYTFHTLEDSIKTGAFFLSEYEYKAPEIQREEIIDDWLLTYDEAMTLLNFPEDREILQAAEAYINEHNNHEKR